MLGGVGTLLLLGHAVSHVLLLRGDGSPEVDKVCRYFSLGEERADLRAIQAVVDKARSFLRPYPVTNGCAATFVRRWPSTPPEGLAEFGPVVINTRLLLGSLLPSTCWLKLLTPSLNWWSAVEGPSLAFLTGRSPLLIIRN